MDLPSKVLFADDKVKHAFERLRNGTSDELQTYQFLVRAFSDIERNSFCGINIPKRLIPKEYKQKYDLDNLWKYDLPNGWRLL